MRISANLFSAGGETTARLITMSLRRLGDRPDLQQRLRDDPDLISPFIEEQLRIESPLKGSFRLARVPATVGGIDLPAGTTVVLMPDAANRDPRQFENPGEFRLDRATSRAFAFGHGMHRASAHRSRGRPRSPSSGSWIARPTSESPRAPRPGRRPARLRPDHAPRLKALHLEFTPVASELT
jgi:hypothetical protein